MNGCAVSCIYEAYMQLRATCAAGCQPSQPSQPANWTKPSAESSGCTTMENQSIRVKPKCTYNEILSSMVRYDAGIMSLVYNGAGGIYIHRYHPRHRRLDVHIIFAFDFLHQTVCVCVTTGDGAVWMWHGGTHTAASSMFATVCMCHNIFIFCFSPFFILFTLPLQFLII